MRYTRIESLVLDKPMVIVNDGSTIASTNYWSSRFNDAGVIICSVNAGALRLLLPQSMGAAVAEMTSATDVILRSLDSSMPNSPSGLELLWEDHSAAPFVIQLSRAQIDRRVSRDEAVAPLECLVYVRGFREAPLLAGRWTARFLDRLKVACH